MNVYNVVYADVERVDKQRNPNRHETEDKTKGGKKRKISFLQTEKNLKNRKKERRKEGIALCR